ncbi:hypothetical protein [Rathayibacter sp. VKM Ac-2760]|nr:hypothetical protein [Rathayibacter sp. VKM Ac-2760]QHC57488.1 hypothetical protein GSU72_02005 [Rathayibacter sp. VKM Ac-2760]
MRRPTSDDATVRRSTSSTALALASVLPMVLLFHAFQRSFVQGFARSGIR